MLEKSIETKFIKDCKKKGWWVNKVNIPGEDGMPDRLVILPKGLSAWVELKAPGKNLRELQQFQNNKLRRYGHKTFKISCKESIPEVIKQIEEYVEHGV